MSERKHSHYFKSVEGLKDIDVYRVLQLFNVADPCLQHAVKKLLVAGGRGGGKDITRDIQEAIDTLKRWQEMRAEETPSSSPLREAAQALAVAVEALPEVWTRTRSHDRTQPVRTAYNHLKDLLEKTPQ